MKFNPSEYETVKERKLRFYDDYPDGRIIVKPISNSPMEYALFIVYVFKNKEEQKENLPFASGTALEIRDLELSVAKSGASYESVNYSSWTENCEESAVGRALDNAGYSGNKKCSREEMQKAKNFIDRKSPDTAPQSETVPIGKHKDKLWSVVPIGYLEWALGTDQDKPLYQGAKKEYDRRAVAPMDDYPDASVECSSDVPF